MADNIKRNAENTQNTQGEIRLAQRFAQLSAWVTHHKAILTAIVTSVGFVIYLMWNVATFMADTNHHLSALSKDISTLTTNVAEIKIEVTENRKKIQKLSEDVARIDGKISTLTNPENNTKRDISF